MNDTIRDEFKKCPRLVHQAKSVDNDARKYWQALFAKLDRNVKIPQHRRLEVLQEVIHQELLKRILKILSVDRKEKVCDVEFDVVDSAVNLLSTRSIHKSLGKSVMAVAPCSSRIDFRKVLTQHSSRMLALKERGNMYLNFLNLPENMAAKWRPKPPITFTGMSLSEKCEAITLSIATDFVEWLKGLGGDEATTLDVPVILNLFEIGFNAHAADSIAVRVKELLSVTKSIANARWVPNIAKDFVDWMQGLGGDNDNIIDVPIILGLFEIGFDSHAADSLKVEVKQLLSVSKPVANSRHLNEASYTAHLYKQLYRDIKSIKTQEDMFAFGTMLPIEMRQVPQKDNIAAKWIQNKRVPENIASMAVVWEGIEHLRSTHGYCNYLRSHLDVPPPPYLLKSGLLNSLDLEDKQFSRPTSIDESVSMLKEKIMRRSAINTT